MNKIEDLQFLASIFSASLSCLHSHKFIFQKFNNIVEDEKTMKMTAMTIIENVHWVEWSELRCYANNRDDKKK